MKIHTKLILGCSVFVMLMVLIGLIGIFTSLSLSRNAALIDKVHELLGIQNNMYAIVAEIVSSEDAQNVEEREGDFSEFNDLFLFAIDKVKHDPLFKPQQMLEEVEEKIKDLTSLAGVLMNFHRKKLNTEATLEGNLSKRSEILDRINFDFLKMGSIGLDVQNEFISFYKTGINWQLVSRHKFDAWINFLERIQNLIDKKVPSDPDMNALSVNLKTYIDLVKSSQQLTNSLNELQTVEFSNWNKFKHISEDSETLADKITELLREELAGISLKFQWTQYLAMLAALGVAVYLSSLFTKYVSHPLELLNTAVIQIGEGNLKTTVDVRSNDELGKLAAAFNQMTAKLNATNHSLLTSMHETEAANKSMHIFLGMMSHELRTPLTTIIGYNDLIREEAGNLPNFQSLAPDLEKIDLSAKHLLYLISNLLDLEKIEAKQLILQSKIFDTVQLANELITSFAPMMRQKGNSISFTCEVGEKVIQSDPVRLRQILFNLFSNANKFTENGKISLSLMKEYADGREWIIFNVHDNGIGMTPEQLSKVFDPFVQADSSTTREYGGVGLGLTLAKKLSELMGGSIAAESIQGEYSSFTVRLPCRLRKEE